MNLIDRVINGYKVRRDKVLKGYINSIPSPFRRFRNDFIGIEQAKYYICTTGTKVGKTQFTSFLFLYNTILYAYNHPEQIRLKIFYFPLEETPEDVTSRFISFLLYYLKGIVVSPVDLNSTKNVAIDESVLKAIEEEEFQNILKFFEQVVSFSDSCNPSGVWFECQRYAKEHGTIYKEKCTYKNELGEEVASEKFSHYVPNDPDEYRIIFYDHVGLVQPERGQDLRGAIAKLSEYFVLLRNRYGFTIVSIQQQNKDSDGLEAFKASRMRPTINNLADNKYTSNDCNVCIGLFAPYRYELKEYLGYDITKLRDNIRFCEVLINRSGQSNGIVALMFLGECNYWAELPLPNDRVNIQKVYEFLNKLKGSANSAKAFLIYAFDNIKRLIKF